MLWHMLEIVARSFFSWTLINWRRMRSAAIGPQRANRALNVGPSCLFRAAQHCAHMLLASCT